MISDTPLPEEFVQQIACFHGLAQALQSEPSVAIRHNPHKGSAANTSPIPWCSLGEWLDARPDFTFDPSMHQGRYYVQDASSMAVYAAISDAVDLLQRADLKVLDMCAAPGGKTTAAIDALPADALVVANEYDYKRAEILAENVAKWGSSAVAVTRGDTARLAKMQGAFDIVIVDAPCSGEGMMRKDAMAREQWSPALVEQCSALQREIIANAWQALAPGGVLIYSTCTFNHRENEEIAEWLTAEFEAKAMPLPRLEAHKDQITAGIDTQLPCYHFLPGKVKGEGLFMAAFVKSKECARLKMPKIKSPYSSASPALAKQVKKWIKRPDDFEIMAAEDTLYAVPKIHLQFIQAVASCTDALTIGTPIATVKGKDIVPVQQLALCNDINEAAFAQCEVDKATAIAYLQRQSIAIEAPKGIVLLTYDRCPLGFVKNLGNRCNNLYPKNWRILRQF